MVFSLNSLRSFLVGFVCVGAVPQMRTRARQEAAPHSARKSIKLMRVVSSGGKTSPHQTDGGLDETNGLGTDSEQKLETDVKAFEQSSAGHSSEPNSQANDVSEQSPGKKALAEMKGVQSEAATRGDHGVGQTKFLSKAEIGRQLCSICKKKNNWNVSCTGTSAIWPEGNITIDGSRRRNKKCFHPHYDSDEEGVGDGVLHFGGHGTPYRKGRGPAKRKAARARNSMCKCLHKYMENCEGTDGTCMQNELCQCQGMCEPFRNQLCTSRLSSLHQRAGSPDQAELSVAEADDAPHEAPEKNTQQTSQLMRTLVSRSLAKAAKNRIRADNVNY